MHQKYKIAFSNSTNLGFIVALKMSGFSIFKIIFLSFGGRVVILYLLFSSLIKGRYNIIILGKTGWVMMRRLEEFREKNIGCLSVFDSK